MSEKEYSFVRILQDIRRRRGEDPITIALWVVGQSECFIEAADWELMTPPNGIPCGADTLIMTTRYSQRFYIPLDKIAALCITNPKETHP